jgi:hypothetical protein
MFDQECLGRRIKRNEKKLRWKDQIKRDMEKINITEEAEDRTEQLGMQGKIGESSRLQMALGW